MSQPAGVFKVRVAVVLPMPTESGEPGLLLLRQNGRPFWVLPGGTLEPGESTAECAVRELMEETGLAISVERLLSLHEFFPGNGRTVMEVTFLGAVVGGALSGELVENIDEVAVFPWSMLPPCQPAPLFETLSRWQAQGFPLDHQLYLGAIPA